MFPLSRARAGAGSAAGAAPLTPPRSSCADGSRPVRGAAVRACSGLCRACSGSVGFRSPSPLAAWPASLRRLVPAVSPARARLAIRFAELAGTVHRCRLHARDLLFHVRHERMACGFEFAIQVMWRLDGAGTVARRGSRVRYWDELTCSLRRRHENPAGAAAARPR